MIKVVLAALLAMSGPFYMTGDGEEVERCMPGDRMMIIHTGTTGEFRWLERWQCFDGGWRKANHSELIAVPGNGYEVELNDVSYRR